MKWRLRIAGANNRDTKRGLTVIEEEHEHGFILAGVRNALSKLCKQMGGDHVYVVELKLERIMANGEVFDPERYSTCGCGDSMCGQCAGKRPLPRS